jgi:hypothetical protein
MATVNTLWLATLTKDEHNADTDAERHNLTVNIDGVDVADMHFYASSWGRGRASVSGGVHGIPAEPLATPFESNLLTNSSIRLGIRVDDAWGPRDVLVLGSTERQVIALAMETDVERWLSSDRSEGKLTMPVRLVGQGSSSTQIRRLLMLVHTGWGQDFGTDDPIELEIAAGGTLVLQHEIHKADQPHLAINSANWFVVDAPVAFTHGDVLGNGSIRLKIHGHDAWRPKVLFLYGLDTSTGRPNEVVHLVSIPEWNLGTLSTDTSEGTPSVILPVV